MKSQWDANEKKSDDLILDRLKFDGKINIHVEFSLLFLNRTNRNDM